MFICSSASGETGSDIPARLPESGERAAPVPGSLVSLVNDDNRTAIATHRDRGSGPMCLPCAGMELRAFAGPHTTMATGWSPGWTRAGPRSLDPRRIPRPRGDVRALPHADQDLARLSGPSQTALVERGRYLFAVASCALCHGADGAGGAKLSWRPLGTVWAQSHTRSGDGARRLDRRGDRARDSGRHREGGRPLQRQASIWDHASNWDEEDVWALIAFLRVLASVRRSNAGGVTAGRR